MRLRQNARAGVRTHRPGPEELVQTAAMARLFYLENKSKIEIAEEFGISRFKVARMLENAIRDGLIRLEIHLPAELDADLSDALRTRFDLTHAIVFTSPAKAPGGEGLARSRTASARSRRTCSPRSSPKATSSDWSGDRRSRRCAPNSPRCPAVPSCS